MSVILVCDGAFSSAKPLTFMQKSQGQYIPSKNSEINLYRLLSKGAGYDIL